MLTTKPLKEVRTAKNENARTTSPNSLPDVRRNAIGSKIVALAAVYGETDPMMIRFQRIAKDTGTEEPTTMAVRIFWMSQPS